MGSIWDKGTPASFEIDGERDRVVFTVVEIVESGGNRIAKRDRVYRDGERLDGMGTMGRTFATRSAFHNGVQEAGVPADLYPGELDKLKALLERSCTTTGTLRLPTKSPQRVKGGTWSIREEVGRDDYAFLDITWFTDTEETELESTFGKPNARGTAVWLADDIAAQIDALGITSDDIARLKEAAKDLEELSQFASERSADLLKAAADVQVTTSNIETSFLPSSTMLNDETFVPGESADSMLAVPIAYDTLMQLRALAEVAAEAAANIPGRAAPEPVVYNRAVSLFDIATDNGVDVDVLVELNPELMDPMVIPANTPILLPGTF